MIPPHGFRAHDKKFLDGMTVGELTSELVLPIKTRLERAARIGRAAQTHRTVLSMTTVQ